MKCARCDFDCPPGMKFCGQCGEKLGALCPRCAAENPPGFKFCGECGSPLAAPLPAEEPPSELQRPTLQAYTPPHLTGLQTRTALEGERKQVSVLFCDIVGSTALADRLGPEVMHLLLNRFFEMALGEVHRYEGTINQFLGDGFMALFGAPIAHEDHPRRAVLAALGLQKLLREHPSELGERHGVELRARMGINTGWVVVGGIGDQLRQDYTAIGDTTNLAARLQEIADPGTVLVSEATMRFLHGAVRMEALEPVRVKGKEAPIQAYRALSAGSLHSEQAVLSVADLSPFVGRQRELMLLDELRQRAAGGEGQVLGIAADPGAGKSRLLYEFRRRLWDKPVLHLAGRCISYGSGIPYLPLLDMLRTGWQIGDGEAPSAVADKIRGHLEAAGNLAEESLPYVLNLLGIREESDRLADLSPQALQARTFHILRQMILNAGRGRLVILQIEDLHWIDQASEEFLAYLVEGLAAAPMLLIATYRAGYRPQWIEKSYATQINLPRLTDRESRHVVDAVLRRAKLADGLLETVLSKAEGNPFFLEELTRSLLESPDVSVPDTIQGVLLSRIDRLPELHKRLLQTASVLGREFQLAHLTAIWEREVSPGPLLADLKRWEFLREEPISDEPLYFFKHALTQEAVYQTLLVSRRQSLHAAAGRAFERLYADRLEDVYDRLAYHYSRAEEPERAVFYLARVAERAAGGYAHAEAVKALHKALEHAANLPAEGRDRTTLELLLQLAASLLPLARLTETLELLDRHRDVMERLGDPALSGRFYFWLAHTCSYLGNQEEAAKNARLAIEEARKGGDAGTEGRAYYVLSRDAFWAGRFSEGINEGLQAVALLERSEDRWWQGQAYWVVGFHQYVLGRFEKAFEAMARAEEIWKALADPRLDPSWSTGYFHSSLGDWEAGIEACQGGLSRAQDPLNTAAALGFLGYAYLEKGDLRQAVEALQDSIARVEQTGMRQLQGWFSVFLADAYIRTSRWKEAEKVARQALTVTREARFWYGVGLAQRICGRIARIQGRFAEAEERLRKALDGFRSLEVPFEEAKTRLDLAVLAHARENRGEAAVQLSEAHRTFVQLGVPQYAEKAERIAEELAVPLALAS
ncbi:MAG TPA: adenylate/guanylate cyclase domain-containing protein [Thermoanaerobaculia bacterium]|nr:adenylate/guanylate cyclase domain-containing protein [Thermoanaerobaculia bacterium]